MANLMTRKPNEETSLQPTVRMPDPMRMMRDLIGWDPFREIAPTWITSPTIERQSFVPAFEVKETKDSFLFHADLPGIKESDVEVKLTGNRLSVSGKRESEQEEKSDTYYACERSYGSFFRSFTLPDGIDEAHVRAELKDGVLTVAVPKKAVTSAKSIPITSGKSKS